MNSNDINNIIKNLYSNLDFNSDEDFYNYLKENNVTERNLKQKLVIEQMWIN